MRADKIMQPVKSTVFIAVAVLLVFSSPAFSQQLAELEKQICDVPADSALGLEDYPTAIKLHLRRLDSQPNDALAHYHLGFAYGMVGRTSDEIAQYRKAAMLGLDKWDLFLNLGLAYAERGELSNASESLERAVSLGPGRVEAHFNLALVYEREHRLNEALREIAISERLDPEDVDSTNTHAILCAEIGDFACARNLWTRLTLRVPEYEPARSNLTLLNRISTTGPAAPDPLIRQVENHEQ
jgi:tetratricopeptide (TPR) repeat protein